MQFAPPYVQEALELRRSHPDAPVRDLLDRVMQRHNVAAIDPDAPWLEPASPFGRLIVEAFDAVSAGDEWATMTVPHQTLAHREALLDVWRRLIVANFLERYSKARPSH